MYDPAGRIERQSIQRDKAPAALSMRRYRYDAAGQLTQIEDSRKGATDYRYDPVGRLIEAIAPGLRERFAFDPASNIVDPGRPENARTQAGLAARSESTLPASVPKVLGNLLREYAGTQFDYDAQGHLVQKRSPAGTQRYEWDAFDRMQAAQVEEGERRSASSYYYDALGRRIAKEVNGARTVFGWDGDTLAYESDEARSTHYVYEARTFVPMAQYVTAPVEGIETPVAREGDRYRPEDDPLQRVPVAQGDARVMFYYCDQIGTPLMMTDEAGEVVWEAAYKAWGETREVIERASAAAGGAVARNALRFQAQQVDDETGLHYNRHRYYDPQVGGFVSKDPIGLAGGFNVYQYAPNPTGWIDPLGLARCPCDPCDKSRRSSLRGIRRQLGIPLSQQPISQKMVPLTDSSGNWLLGDDNKPVMTRELTYQVGDKNVIIQDHSAGHVFGEGGIGDQPSHHNVRPEDNTRTGKIQGMDDHYYFDCRNKK